RRLAKVGVVVHDQHAQAHVLIVADAGADHIVASRNLEHECHGPAPTKVCSQLHFGPPHALLASAAEFNRQGADMKVLTKNVAVAVVLLLVSVAVASASVS